MKSRPEIVALLPVSRNTYLDRVIDSLERQTVRPQSLIVIFDGSDQDYLTARNKVIGLKYRQVLCVKSNNEDVAVAIPDRRKHIVSIHNQVREIVSGADWVFSIEDDGILPPNALSRLLTAAKTHDNAGMITGVELGRWGVPYVGAWRVDDLNNTKRLTSMPSRAGEDAVEEIDACGLYCALIRGELYKGHEFTCDNGLGPDVNLGLFIRKLGYNNYIDWSLSVTHLTTKSGVEVEIPATDWSQIVELEHGIGSYWRQIKY